MTNGGRRAPAMRACAWIAVVGASAAACAVAAMRAGTSTSVYGNDFTVFYAAAANVRATLDPYHHPLAERWPYLYPPLFAQLLAPLTCASLPAAAFLWAAGNLLASALTMRRAERMVFADATASVAARRTFRAAFAVAFAPLVLGNALLGQVNVWIALLIATALDQDARARPRSAGLALALAISVKLTPATLLAYAAARRSWRFAFWTVAWLVGVQAVSFAALGAHRRALAREWFSVVVVNGWKFNFAGAGNQSLRGAAERFFSSGATDVAAFPTVTVIDLGGGWTWIWLFATAAVMGALIATARQASGAVRHGHAAAAASVACCAVPLVSKLSWTAHFAVLALPLACALKFALEKSRSDWRARGAVVVLLTGFWCNSRVFPLTFREWCEAHSVFTALALGLLAYCVGASGKTGKSGE
jgi:alpha-1,2-mannosyltransferase